MRANDDWVVISSYTRAQAIEDGVLVDVSETAKEAGFKVPVALTAGVYHDFVGWTKADSEATDQHQNEAGRLWDVLWMARHAARGAAGDPQVTIRQLLVPRPGSRQWSDCRRPDADAAWELPDELCAVMHIGPGDAGEPVVTIMYPDED